MRSLSFLSVGVSVAMALLACSKDSSPSNDGASTDRPDVGYPDDQVDAASNVDADPGSADAGLVPSKSTAVDADLAGVTRTLHRAQFGVDKKGASETVYLEAHEGGAEACPETATPKRTMIVSGVPEGAPGASFDEGDGVKVSFLDFTGDQITADNPTTKASKAKVTIVSFAAGDSVEIAVEATFPEGTAKGRIYATYCEAMSSTE